MALGRVIMGVACLAAASAGEAAAPHPVRLPLSLAALGAGPEIAYHPNRWLTVRRDIAFPRPSVLHERPVAAPPAARLRRVEALTGDVHPFGGPFRVSLGLREARNHRLLRMSGDAAGTGTARYAPMMAVGMAGEMAPGLSIGADIGFVGRAFVHADADELITPLDQARRQRDGGVRPLVQLSAGYRF